MGVIFMKSHQRGAKYLATVADYHMQMTEKWKNATNSVSLTSEPDSSEP